MVYLRYCFCLVLFFASGALPARAYTPPDNPVACIQRILISHGAKLSETGKLSAKTKSAAVDYAKDKGWNLPPLDENGTDAWCDYLTAELIGVPWLTSLPHPGEPYYDVALVRQRPATVSCFAPLAGFGRTQSPGEPQAEIVLDGPGEAPWGNDFMEALIVYELALIEQKPVGATVAMYSRQIDTFADRMKSAMLDWAAASVPTRVPVNDRDNYLWGMSALFPHVLLARNLLVNAGMLDTDETATIDSWLAKLASDLKLGKELTLGTELPDPTSRYRNHNTHRALDALLWAIQTNDATLFNWAVRTGYVRFLRTIYADGHLPEAYRSSWAEWYGALAIDAALFTAVAAEHQGVDLFDLKVANRGVSDTVRFWASAYEDQSLVNKYAKEQKFNPVKFPGHQETSFRYIRLGAPISMAAWVDLYLDRFPADPVIPTLMRIREDIATKADNRYFSSFVFGNVSCFWGPESGRPFPKPK